jgi:hypothetical protein
MSIDEADDFLECCLVLIPDVGVELNPLEKCINRVYIIHNAANLFPAYFVSYCQLSSSVASEEVVDCGVNSSAQAVHIQAIMSKYQNVMILFLCTSDAK